MKNKLNSMRLLESLGIAYMANEYDALGEFHSAVEAAQLLGAPADSVYKTLVVLRDPPNAGKPMLVMIASDAEVDLKVLAKSLGKAKQKLRMATQREAESLTGLQVGGISALGLLNRGFEIYLDSRAAALGQIHISAGQRGVDLQIAVNDLIEVTRAKVVEAVAR